MSSTIIIELSVAAFAILIWIISAYEAYSSLTGGRVRKIESTNEKLAQKLDKWMEHDASIRAVLKLFMLVDATFLGIFIYRLVDVYHHGLKNWWWGLVLVILILVTILCEIAARLLLMRLDIFILRMTIPFIRLISKTVLAPFAIAVEKISSTTETWEKERNPDKKVSVEDEIMSYVEDYTDEAQGDLEEGEKQMIRGILEIGDMSVREIMTPRVDLFALPATASVDEAKKIFIDSGHSRIPVYGRSIDEIRGILYAKDFLNTEKIKSKTLLQMAHTPIFIPETKEVAELLEEIKRSRNHFAVIIDEYGGTSGVVTFEDIIEEIVGEVHDEYDTESDFKNRPQLLPDGDIMVESRILLSDINELLDADLPESEDTDTLGGYICSQMGKIPIRGSVFTVPGKFKAIIKDADTRKIKFIQLHPLEEDEGVEQAADLA